ncbi:MAG: lipid A deacylase LpxR family protein [Rickettsiales bacterium]
MRKLFFCSLAFFMCSSYAEEAKLDPYAKRRQKDEKGIVSVMVENDVFANADKHYTNGARVSYLSPETSVSKHIEKLGNKLLLFKERAYKRYSYSFGQSMFTPKNIKVSNPSTRDRPYAGWTYVSMGIISSNKKRLDNFEVSVGMVGPASLAEQTQKTVHKVVGSPDPKGWDHQLKNELGVFLSYDRQWRNQYQFETSAFKFNVTPSVGANLGNVYTDLSAGIMTRFGRDIPFDYGPPRIRPSIPGSDFFIPKKDLGWYLFAGVEGRAVARNIFLDGNTFRSSRHVKKNGLVGDFQVGAVMTWRDLRIGYTHVVRTREFKTQTSSDQFGAISLSYRM